MIDNKKQYIICAAIHIDTDKQYPHQPKNIEQGYVICGRRHHNAIFTNLLIEDEHTPSGGKLDITQGFLTSDDLFVSRKEAAVIAFKAKQITIDTDALLSEDLY